VSTAPISSPELIAQAIAPADDGTGTQLTTSGNQTDIQGGTLSGDGANLFHSFQQFGLSQEQIANFLASPDIRNILGRIVGGDPSVIDGTVRITGGNSNLYLMNPAGVIFGANARLDVPAAFTATTANGISFGEDLWFSASGENPYTALQGDPTGFAFTSEQPGSIANAGDLAVAEGQSLTLTGGTVVNTGTLTAPGGLVTVLAVPGQHRVRVSQPGVLLELEIEPIAGGPNDLPYVPASLPTLLTGGEVQQVTGIRTNPDGTVALTGTRSPLPGTEGTAIVSGGIDVLGTTGGEVNVLGDRVAVTDAAINASGTYGGGTVRIGGDYQGQGTVPNASQTLIDQDVQVSADALLEGNGGLVVGWANDTASIHGTLTARGGSLTGDGGLVETSSRESLNLTATVDASAPNGEAGTWLIDPTNITIVSGDGGAIGTNQVGATLISNALNTGTNIDFDTSTATGGGEFDVGNITQLAGATIEKTAGGDVTLTFQAENNIVLNDDILSNSGALNVILNADSDASGSGSISLSTAEIRSNGGNIVLGGGTDPLDNPAISIETSFGDGIDISDSVLDTSGGNISARGLATASGAGIRINSSTLQTGQTGNGTVTLNGQGPTGILFNVGSIQSNNGNISLIGVGTQFAGLDIAGFNGSSEIRSTGDGNIILNGTVSDGANTNIGIRLGDNAGVFTQLEGAIRSTGTGDVSLNATGGRSISVEVGIIESGSGELTLTADVIALPNATFTGTGDVLLQPENPAVNFALSGPELNSLGGDFSLITIGRANSSGTITVTGDVTFNSPVSLRSPAGEGAIDTSKGILRGADDATITLEANQNITVDSISNPGRAITLTSVEGNIIANLLTSEVTGSTNVGDGGEVELTAGRDISVESIATNSISFGGSAGNAGSVSLQAGEDIAVSSIFSTTQAVTTAGNGGPVSLQAGGTINIDSNTPNLIGFQ
ncbi:filamentous hemagglutinin, partial [filamentous cyanobacterium CCP5]